MSIINLISRQSQVFVGGKQFPFESVTLNDSAWSESGLITCSGRVVLKATPGFDESLDDRINTRFWEGQLVEIYTADTAGVLRLHPRGTLRILTASYEAPTLTLEVGCELTYGARNEPTDPDEAEVEIGQSRAIKNVAGTLAQKAGVGVPVIGSLPDYAVNYPIDIEGGSYLSAMGQMLYSLNAIAWCRNTGIVEFGPLSQFAEPLFTAIVGETAKPPQRLNDPERPPEIVRVTGNGTCVKPTSGDDNYVRETFIAGKLFRRLEITTTLSGNIKRRVTVEEEKLEGILSGLEVEDDYNLNLMWTKERKEETWTYESGDSGKLLRYRSEIYKPFALACRSFVSWHKSNESAYWKGAGFKPSLRSSLLRGGVILAGIEETFYDYDLQERTRQIRTNQWLTESEILGATSIDWQEFKQFRSPSNPTLVKLAAIAIDEWVEVRKGQWEKRETQREATALRDPNRYDGASLGSILATGFNLSSSDEEVRESNSGQEQPPAPERRTPKFVAEQYPVEEEAKFPRYGGSHNPRTRTFQIPYLAGTTASDKPRQQRAIAPSSEQRKQAQTLAQAIGKMLIGRHKGDRIDFPLLDVFFDNYKPLITIDATHNGVTRRYLMDATTWVITPTETIVSCDGIWLGTVQDGNLVLPYQELHQLRGGFRLGGRFEPYIEPPNPSQVLRSGFRLGGRLLGNEELEEELVAGFMICTGDCAIGHGGKAVQFPSESYGTHEFLVVPEGLSISAGANAIQVFRWSQLPNTSLIGRQWVADLSEQGGKFSVTIDATYQWISVFAQNPSNGGYHDGCCFLWTGKAALLMDYS